ncbi:hypothetical protein CAOG_03053 [Capsaspora owczarzaki ATCC 30864]|uniref:SET domain-containing protein n=1 Tax=Capsaspora owczarzaki (strain ATCC 30864) TaxID=595528 RepID=A0A0D2UAE7_CAPO3|nr:hypothetical protein CAOG_03053 [Capsaspora owczarzaki ATCC 30864]KJE92016.1 hypothetical protein CAOG_003053 [Capsaspora owczarzaki ATCC 30864]|eukprot:XP_004363892.1 hypothetical protein CAOG_03053 [Capsaspora owczarzaki ATCC 30864]
MEQPPAAAAAAAAVLPMALTERFPVAVREDAARGRYMVATRAIAAGETVFVALPYAYAVFTNCRKRVCAFCLLYDEQGRLFEHCAMCDQVYYCSAQCRQRDMDIGLHQRLCHALKKTATMKDDRHLSSIARLVVVILHRRASAADLLPLGIDGRYDTPPAHLQARAIRTAAAAHAATGSSASGLASETESDHNDAAAPATPTTTPSTTPSAGGPTGSAASEAPSAASVGDLAAQGPVLQRVQTQPNTASSSSSDPSPAATPSTEPQLSPEERAALKSSIEDVSSLVSHVDKWTVPEAQGFKKLLRFLEKHVEAELMAGFPLKDVLKLVSQIESNGFGLWDGKGECYARALFPSASFFNHSCDPSCDRYQDKFLLSIATRRPIAAGEELSISYIDVNAPCRTRQHELLDSYHFQCSCTRCVRELAAHSAGSKSRDKEEREKITYSKSAKPGSGTKGRNSDKANQKLPAKAKLGMAGPSTLAAAPGASSSSTGPTSFIAQLNQMMQKTEISDSASASSPRSHPN